MMAHYQDAEEFHFNISSVVSRFSEHSEENSHTLLIINIQVLPLKCLKSSARCHKFVVIWCQVLALLAPQSLSVYDTFSVTCCWICAFIRHIKSHFKWGEVLFLVISTSAVYPFHAALMVDFWTLHNEKTCKVNGACVSPGHSCKIMF